MKFADEVLEHWDVWKALEEAPHVPIAGASPASMFNEKVQVGLPFCDDIIALRAMDISPKYLLLLPVQSENPRDVRLCLVGVQRVDLKCNSKE